MRSVMMAGAAIALPATAAAQGTASQTTQAFFDALWARRSTDAGILGPPDGSKPCGVLIDFAQLDSIRGDS